MKAHLKGSHYVAAIIAGIVGNIFFSAGWSLLGVTLFFGLFAAIFGGSIESIIGQFTDPAAISGFFSSAGGIAAGLTVGFSIAALVLVGLGVLFSGLILKGGKVRKPWATTWLSVLISALLSVPLFFVWLAIANNTNGAPIALVVVPRTMESSTTTSLRPAMLSRSGLSFMRTPSARISWLGAMNVRPM